MLNEKHNILSGIFKHVDVLEMLRQSSGFKTIDSARKEPGATGRPRRVNAGPDKKVFAATKAPKDIQGVTNDKPKFKYIAEGKVHPNEIPRAIQNKIQAKKANQLAIKHDLSDQEFKRPMQNNPVIQKIPAAIQKNPAVIQKNPAVIQKNPVLIHKSPAVIQNNPAVIQKPPVIQKNSAATQKAKLAQAANIVQKQNLAKAKLAQDIQNAKQEKVAALQKSKLEDATISQKTKVQKTGVTNQNIKPVNPQAKTKSALESVQNTKSVQKEAPVEPTKNVKGTTASEERNEGAVEKISKASGEKRELDAVLGRAVEEELKDIMLQVWQALPDDPPEEEDRIAVDKLRNEIADELRRVLGLNVTKRLLNVFNNLFVKMQFTCRPHMGCLTSFLNEYRINKFKRIDKNSNTFAAQMETIEEFDKLCANKVLTCGEAKVTVTPCYKFTVCPENLKTIYDDTFFCDDTVPENTESTKDNKCKDELHNPAAQVANNKCIEPESAKIEKEVRGCEQNTKTISKKSAQQIVVKKAEEVKDDALNTTTTVKNANDKCSQLEAAKIEQKLSNNIQRTKATVANCKQVILEKAEAAKSSNDKNIEPDSSKKAEESRDHAQKTKAKIENGSIKPKAKRLEDIDVKPETDSTKPTVADDFVKVTATDNKEKSTEKSISVKSKKASDLSKKQIEVDKDKLEDKEISDYIIKDILDSSEDDLELGDPENGLEGDEELGDEDILALMSEGVVLDECSGSEDEK